MPAKHSAIMKRFFTGAAWSTAFRFGGLLATLVVNMLLTRLLPPEEVGLYFLIFSGAMFFSIIARFGLKQSVVKIIAEAATSGDLPLVAGASRKIFIITVVGIIITGSILGFGLGEWLFINLFHSHLMISYLPHLLGWMAILALLAPLAATFRGLNQINWGTALDNSAANIALAFMLAATLVLPVKLNLGGILSIVLVAYFTMLASGLVRLRRSLPTPVKTKIMATKTILTASAPVFIINLFTYIVANASIWVVGYYLPAAEVGIYGIVLKVFNLIALPLLIISMVIDPMITELHIKRKRSQLQDILQFSATLAFFVTLAITIIILFKGGELLTLLFGAEYAVGYPILAVLAIGNLVNVWTGLCNNYLLMTGGQLAMMYITVISGIMTILLAIILVQKMGSIGVGLAVAISLSAKNLSAWALVLHKCDIRTNPSFSQLIRQWRSRTVA